MAKHKEVPTPAKKKGSIVLSNFSLRAFINWLNKQQLHSKETIQRSRFVKLAKDRYNEIEEFRLGLLKKYEQKDAKTGERIVKDNNVQLTDEVAFLKEYNDYLAMEWVLDITPERKETISVIKQILTNTREEFSGQLADLYVAWVEAFE